MSILPKTSGSKKTHAQSNEAQASIRVDSSL